MTRTLTAYLVDVNKETSAPILIKDTLSSYYTLLNCACIDIVSRRIGRKSYSIVCDDEGLFSNDPKISAIDDMGKVMFVGNLIIVGDPDEHGELQSLTQDDINYLSECILPQSTRNHLKPYPMLHQCRY